MRCHLAYQTGISIYMIWVSETEKPILPNCWQQSKPTEPLQWNGQCVHFLIQTGKALRKCLLKSYFHMSKITSSRVCAVPLFIMSCQMKQQMFKVREWKAKLHVTTRQEYEEERTEHAAIAHQYIPHQRCFQWSFMKCELGKRHDKEYYAQCKASLKPKVKPTKWGGTQQTHLENHRGVSKGEQEKVGCFLQGRGSGLQRLCLLAGILILGLFPT